MEGGVSQRELGRKLWRRLGYASPHSCANSLSKMFLSKGWRTRERIEAVRLHNTTHGLCSMDALGTPLSRALINDRQNRRKARFSRQCAATTRNGRQCLVRFKGEGTLCWLHTDEGRAAIDERLRDMRARKAA